MGLKTPKVIVFCGKGGAGKTSICALTIKCFMEVNKKILAIDADPAGGLSWALGIFPHRTLDDLQHTLSQALHNKEVASFEELSAIANYELLSTLIESKGFDFIAVGRPEAEGCYCGINSFLRHCIGVFIQHYDVVCIDGEAGLEQVNRRVLDTVTHLVIVSDTSKRSVSIAKSLHALSQNRMNPTRCGIIINKMSDSNCEADQLPVIGTLPVSDTIVQSDAEGKSLLEIDDHDTYYTQLKEVMRHFL